jgi:hypothetical protein
MAWLELRHCDNSAFTRLLDNGRTTIKVKAKEGIVMQNPETPVLEAWVEPTIEALDVRETESNWFVGTDGGATADSTLS